MEIVYRFIALWMARVESTTYEEREKYRRGIYVHACVSRCIHTHVTRFQRDIIITHPNHMTQIHGRMHRNVLNLTPAERAALIRGRDGIARTLCGGKRK